MTEASSQTNARSAEPRDARWVGALPYLVGGVALIAVLKVIGVIPGNGGLPSGIYQCMTATNIAPYGRQVPRSREELRDQTGQEIVGDIMVPGAMAIPAPFGNIEIDGDGGYRMVGNGAVGDYSLSSGRTSLSFTGEMSVLTVTAVDSDSGRFLASYEDMRFDCGPLRS